MSSKVSVFQLVTIINLNVLGSTVVQDSRNSFLLTKDKRMFAFKSFKKVIELMHVSNIIHFESFGNCYVAVEQVGIDFRVKIFSSFGDELDICHCDFDLSYGKDPVSINDSRDSEEICVLMLEGPLGIEDIKFFNELLVCDIEQEAVHDILLMSINDRLIWIKYKDSFFEGASERCSIEIVSTMKGNIRGMKHCASFLMILDDNSMLTILYLCPVTQIIKKREILLEGKIRSFRFHDNTLIYSNFEKIVFVDVTEPISPLITSVNLRFIVCFTVVAQQKFIIAICANRLFYFVPIKVQNLSNKQKRNQFEELGDGEIESIPGIAKFLKKEEEKLLGTEQKIKDAQKLRTLMQHLMTEKNFNAGNAVVKFHQNFPPANPKTIICKTSSRPVVGSCFIEIKLEVPEILQSTTFSISIHRCSPSSGVATRMIRIESAQSNEHIIIPGEPSDDPSNKMNLELNFSYEVRSETRLLTFPINIKQIIPFDGPRIKLKSSLDDCLKLVEKMKT